MQKRKRYTKEFKLEAVRLLEQGDRVGAVSSNLARVTLTVNAIPVGRILSGAAKRSVTPSQEHIDGVTAQRLGGAPHQQQFNLGGFGIDPVQNFPDPIGGFGAQLTEPAGSVGRRAAGLDQ